MRMTGLKIHTSRLGAAHPVVPPCSSEVQSMRPGKGWIGLLRFLAALLAVLWSSGPVGLVTGRGADRKPKHAIDQRQKVH